MVRVVTNGVESDIYTDDKEKILIRYKRFGESRLARPRRKADYILPDLGSIADTAKASDSHIIRYR